MSTSEDENESVRVTIINQNSLIEHVFHKKKEGFDKDSSKHKLQSLHWQSKEL